MTAKISEKCRRTFLKAFARSGNLTLAAEQAGMSRSWVNKARRADAEFARACRAAKAAAGERLRASRTSRPPTGPGRHRGAELVVRGKESRRPQVVRAGEGQWTRRAEERALAVLRLTCNLRLACDAAGLTPVSLDRHRRRWPDFERRLQEALAFGRVRLEAALEAERERPFDPGGLPDRELPPPSIAEALAILRRHRPSGRRPQG
jgi:hypothetical protein